MCLMSWKQKDCESWKPYPVSIPKPRMSNSQTSVPLVRLAFHLYKFPTCLSSLPNFTLPKCSHRAAIVDAFRFAVFTARRAHGRRASVLRRVLRHGAVRYVGLHRVICRPPETCYGAILPGEPKNQPVRSIGWNNSTYIGGVISHSIEKNMLVKMGFIDLPQFSGEKKQHLKPINVPLIIGVKQPQCNPFELQHGITRFPTIG